MDEDYIWDVIEEYTEEYAEEIGLDTFDDNDVKQILFNICDNKEIDRIVHEEIEDYASYKRRMKKRGE